MELKPVYLFIIAFIVVTLGIVTLQTSSSNIEQVDVYSNSSTSNFTSTSLTTTLSPVEEGITSNTIQTNNQTWLNFDGVNDGLIVSSVQTINTSLGYTISSWFRSTANNSEYNNTFVYFRSTDTGYPYIQQSLRASSGVPKVFTKFFPNQTGCDNSLYSSTNALNDGYWHNAIMIFNGTYLFNYIDGVNAGSAALDVNCIQYLGVKTYNSSIGAGMNGTDLNGQYYNGALDEIRVYNKPLNSTEISSIYNSGRNLNSSLSSAGLLYWYPFNEGNGTTVHDFSGNGGDAK